MSGADPSSARARVRSGDVAAGGGRWCDLRHFVSQWLGAIARAGSARPAALVVGDHARRGSSNRHRRPSRRAAGRRRRDPSPRPGWERSRFDAGCGRGSGRVPRDSPGGDLPPRLQQREGRSRARTRARARCSREHECRSSGGDRRNVSGTDERGRHTSSFGTRVGRRRGSGGRSDRWMAARRRGLAAGRTDAAAGRRHLRARHDGAPSGSVDPRRDRRVGNDAEHAARAAPGCAGTATSIRRRRQPRAANSARRVADRARARCPTGA